MQYNLWLFLCICLTSLVPQTGWGQGYFEREVAEERTEWFPFDPVEIIAVVFPVPEEEVPPSKEFRIEINIPERRLYLFQGGKAIRNYPVAVGSARYRTPIGPRYLKDITWNPWWFPPPYSDWARGARPTPPGPSNPLGPVKMSLGGDIRLHGTNKEISVGHPVSHGCMRMRNNDARELAWFLQTRFSDQTDEILMEKYGKNRSRSFFVKLNRTIPVTIAYDRVAIHQEGLEVYPDIYDRDNDLWRQLLTELSTIGIPPWEVNPTKLESLTRVAETTRVPIGELVTF